MSASGYFELRGHAGEDYTLTVTVGGTGSIAAWTLAGTLWGPDGAEVPGAVSAAVTDGPGRVVTAAIAGLNLARTAYYAPYRFEVRRTDPGSRTVVAWGTLELTDPRPA